MTAIIHHCEPEGRGREDDHGGSICPPQLRQKGRRTLLIDLDPRQTRRSRFSIWGKVTSSMFEVLGDARATLGRRS